MTETRFSKVSQGLPHNIILIIRSFWMVVLYMIWIYIFMPVIILSGIAIYFEKKSGAISLEEGKTADKLEEYPPEHGMNSFNPF
ncbi:hypothetical protein FB550_111126 [Neobacillus bataviensis]|uniref:Uncharacterized protein n=2 Tax=Neobacillus bataviensis TaxID=220685 RepID=A0A561D072_9BACI|nr:hypothetical protein FB550_111126 [Neobacillus bataviensis]